MKTIYIVTHYMGANQLPAVSLIDRRSFNPWWTEEQIRQFVATLRNARAIVATLGGHVAGYALVTVSKSLGVDLVRFAVAAEFRRQGVASKLMDKTKHFLSKVNCHKISCHVRESQLDAQLFLKASGFRANKVLRNYFDDNGEDCYLFEHEPLDASKSEPVF